MIMHRSLVKWSFVVALFVLLLCATCQRDSGKIGLRLDQPLKSSFESSYLASSSGGQAPLNPFETVVYDHGITRVNARSTDIDLGYTRFRLGMVDVNQDGRYSTPGMDLLVISFYGNDKVNLYSDLPSIGVFQAKNFIQVDRSCFLVTDIDSSGQSISLIPWDRCPSETLTARLKTSVGKMALKTWSGEDTFLSAIPGSTKERLIILYSLASDEGSLLRRLEADRARWTERVDVQIVSMLDDVQDLKAFLADFSTALPLYRATAEHCQLLNCHTKLPFGMHLDGIGRIIRIGLDEEEILELLTLTNGMID